MIAILMKLTVHMIAVLMILKMGDDKRREVKSRNRHLRLKPQGRRSSLWYWWSHGVRTNLHKVAGNTVQKNVGTWLISRRPWVHPLGVKQAVPPVPCRVCIWFCANHALQYNRTFSSSIRNITTCMNPVTVNSECAQISRVPHVFQC